MESGTTLREWGSRLGSPASTWGSRGALEVGLLSHLLCTRRSVRCSRLRLCGGNAMSHAGSSRTPQIPLRDPPSPSPRHLPDPSGLTRSIARALVRFRPSAPSSGADWLRARTGGRHGQWEAGAGAGGKRRRRARRGKDGGPWEGFGDSRSGSGALEALRESLQYIWGSLEGVAGLGALRDAQGVLGVIGSLVLRVPERWFGIPRHRFMVGGGWCASERPRGRLAVREGRRGPHVVWEVLGVVKEAESWDPADGNPPISPMDPLNLLWKHQTLPGTPKPRQDSLSAP